MMQSREGAGQCISLGLVAKLSFKPMSKMSSLLGQHEICQNKIIFL